MVCVDFQLPAVSRQEDEQMMEQQEILQVNEKTKKSWLCSFTNRSELKYTSYQGNIYFMCVSIYSSVDSKSF